MHPWFLLSDTPNYLKKQTVLIFFFEEIVLKNSCVRLPFLPQGCRLQATSSTYQTQNKRETAAAARESSTSD